MSKHLELLGDFIKLYHKNFDILYDRKNLEKLNCHNRLEEEKFLEFKNYFTHFVYPVQNNREKLDLAFNTLKRFVFNPKLVFLILGQMGMQLLKSKISIPDIIKISTKTLKYYNHVIKFEKKLIKTYIQVKKEVKSENEHFKATLKSLPKKQLYENLDYTLDFLSILESKEFINHLISILESVLHIVAKDKYCNEKEIDGLNLVISMVKNGAKLLENFSDKQIKELIAIIAIVEKDFLDHL